MYYEILLMNIILGQQDNNQLFNLYELKTKNKI